MLIHQIWIGTKPPPTDWMRTVKDFCADYGHVYCFWGNNEVKHVPLKEYGLEALYREFEGLPPKERYPGQVDLLRLVILHQQGGMYVDADCVIVNPPLLDQFIRANERGMVVGHEDEHLIANSVILCEQGLPFLAEMIAALPAYAAKHSHEMVWKRSGPQFLTDFAYAHPSSDVFVVPKNYFYYGGWKGARDKDAHTRMRFPPEAMMFQYGYSTNDLGGRSLPKKEALALIAALGAAYGLYRYLPKNLR